MRTLLALKEQALANPAWFRQVVMTGGLNKIIPGKQNIVRCPRVEWEKYGSLGLRLGRELEKPAPMDTFYTVSFDKSRLIQGVQIFPPLDPREEGSL
jgi:hypothetical protein